MCNDVNGYLVDIDNYKVAVRIYGSLELASGFADNGYNISRLEFIAKRFVEESEKMLEETKK